MSGKQAERGEPITVGEGKVPDQIQVKNPTSPPANRTSKIVLHRRQRTQGSHEHCSEKELLSLQTWWRTETYPKVQFHQVSQDTSPRFILIQGVVCTSQPQPIWLRSQNCMYPNQGRQDIDLGVSLMNSCKGKCDGRQNYSTVLFHHRGQGISPRINQISQVIQ